MRTTNVLLFFLLFAGCKVQYTFTGINIDAETITINSFYNDAEGGPPDLAQVFTDEMRDYFQRNTRMTLVDDGGDLIYEGSVTGYRLTPVAPQGGTNPNEISTASETRLTITVKVSFINQKDESTSFEKNYDFFAQFEADQALADVEQELIEEIYDQIILNIFNDSVANW